MAESVLADEQPVREYRKARNFELIMHLGFGTMLLWLVGPLVVIFGGVPSNERVPFLVASVIATTFGILTLFFCVRKLKRASQRDGEHVCMFWQGWDEP